MALSVSLACLIPAVLLPYVWAGVSVPLRKAQLGAIDNKDPRAQVAKLTGSAARAYAAHQNAFEALIVFSAAVLTAHAAGADPEWSARLAVGWVVLRVGHGIAYITNADKIRSSLFALALTCAIGLFVLAARAS